MHLCSQPLSDTQRNGPELRYVVSWRRKDHEEEWHNVSTTSTKYVVSDTETYVPYEIRIQAVNDFGRGPESNIVTGYSGEDSKYQFYNLSLSSVLPFFQLFHYLYYSHFSLRALCGPCRPQGVKGQQHQSECPVGPCRSQLHSWGVQRVQSEFLYSSDKSVHMMLLSLIHMCTLKLGHFWTICTIKNAHFGVKSSKSS